MPPKTVTRQVLIGERGIALIARRCLDMNYLFHPRRVDHGIDGHIDLVDPDSGVALSLALLVQSKAQDLPFSGENDHSFHFVCDQRDLDYWLAGNTPVVLVFSHPNQESAWWVEVKEAFRDATARASRTVRIDKRTQAFDKSAAASLLRLAQPRASGLYLRPPPIDERLTTNLLPLVVLPPVIHVARAVVTDYTSAWDRLPEPRPRSAAWTLGNGQVASFENLRTAGLGPLLEGPMSVVPVEEWSDSTDPGVMNRFSRLVSATVEHAHPELRRHASRKHVHFRPTEDLSPRKAGKRAGAAGRTVFGPHMAKSDPTRVSYYHHAALQMRFRRIAKRWYCQLEPGYCFTYDGLQESSFADNLLAGIKRRERHAAVAGWTAMWAAHLTDEPNLFSRPRPLRFAPLLTVDVDRGIDDRWWGAAPSNAASDEDRDEHVDARRDPDTDLATADIDLEDLFTLLDEPEDVDDEEKPGDGGEPSDEVDGPVGR